MGLFVTIMSCHSMEYSLVAACAVKEKPMINLTGSIAQNLH
jgi:hypothetical protein